MKNKDPYEEFYGTPEEWRKLQEKEERDRAEFSSLPASRGSSLVARGSTNGWSVVRSQKNKAIQEPIQSARSNLGFSASGANTKYAKSRVSGAVFVGQRAKNKIDDHPDDAYVEFKRHMGTKSGRVCRA